MFDSHNHLHHPSLAGEVARLLSRARAAGVTGMLLAGVDPEGWRDQARLAASAPELAVALGVHPQRVAELDDAAAEAMVGELDGALDRAGARAVGEVGLDGLVAKGAARAAQLARQERAFRAQLATARRRDLPVVLHVVRAHGRALAILRGDGLPRAGGVLHSASGAPEVIRAYLALRLHVSFAGSAANPEARRVHAAVACVPIERLLVETDAPFQTPHPLRPAKNEPAFLVQVVDAVAAIRGESARSVAAATEANARRLLRIT